MASVQDHYRNLLAKHYTWMMGASFEEKVAEQKVCDAGFRLRSQGVAGRLILIVADKP